MHATQHIMIPNVSSVSTHDQSLPGSSPKHIKDCGGGEPGNEASSVVVASPHLLSNSAQIPGIQSLVLNPGQTCWNWLETFNSIAVLVFWWPNWFRGSRYITYSLFVVVLVDRNFKVSIRLVVQCSRSHTMCIPPSSALTNLLIGWRFTTGLCWPSS